MINQSSHSNHIHGLIWSLARRDSLLYYSYHLIIFTVKSKTANTSFVALLLTVVVHRCSISHAAMNIRPPVLLSQDPRFHFNPLYLKRQITTSFNPFFPPEQCILILAHPWQLILSIYPYIHLAMHQQCILPTSGS